MWNNLKVTLSRIQKTKFIESAKHYKDLNKHLEHGTTRLMYIFEEAITIEVRVNLQFT